MPSTPVRSIVFKKICNSFLILLSVSFSFACANHLSKTPAKPAHILSGSWQLTQAVYNDQAIDVQNHSPFLKVYHHDSLFSGFAIENNGIVKTMEGIYHIKDSLYSETIREKSPAGLMAASSTNIFSGKWVTDTTFMIDGNVQIKSNGEPIHIHLNELWQRMGSSGEALSGQARKLAGMWKKVKGVYNGNDLSNGPLTLKVVDGTGFKNYVVGNNHLIKATQGSFTLKNAAYDETILWCNPGTGQVIGSVNTFKLSFSGDNQFILTGGVHLLNQVENTQMSLYEVWQKME